MKTDFKEQTPCISLTILASLCFVTLMMCQTRFKITKEMSREIYPPIVRSKDCWFLYTFGNPDRFKCVLRAFVVFSSPVISFISTGLLIFGKLESNPYLFLPWLFLTIKGLLLIQTDNIITILKDMATRTNYAYGFRAEDLKWLIFYFTIFLIDLVEVFSFFEIFDLFIVLWNHHPGYSVESASLEAVKREMADIMETLSKCSLGSLSKISFENYSTSDVTNENSLTDIKSLVRLAPKDQERKRIFHAKDPLDNLLMKDSPISIKNLTKRDVQIRSKTNLAMQILSDVSDGGDSPGWGFHEIQSDSQIKLIDMSTGDKANVPKEQKLDF